MTRKPAFCISTRRAPLEIAPESSAEGGERFFSGLPASPARCATALGFMTQSRRVATGKSEVIRRMQAEMIRRGQSVVVYSPSPALEAHRLRQHHPRAQISIDGSVVVAEDSSVPAWTEPYPSLRAGEAAAHHVTKSPRS